MKKMIFFMLMLSAAVFLLAGCDNEKEFSYEIKNVSGKDWVLIGDFDTNFVYTGDNYGLDSAFTIKGGKSQSESFSAERLIESGRLQEKSKTSYEIVMRFIAGDILKVSEEGTISKDLIMQDITVSGTYGKNAVIEWDGSNFKQLK